MTLCPLQARLRAEVFGEMGERAHHWIRRKAAERTERTELHGVAEIFEHFHVGGTLLVPDDAIDHRDAARRPDPAERALAAGFDGAEFERKARLLGHVHGIVAHHDTAVADQ